MSFDLNAWFDDRRARVDAALDPKPVAGVLHQGTAAQGHLRPSARPQAMAPLSQDHAVVQVNPCVPPGLLPGALADRRLTARQEPVRAPVHLVRVPLEPVQNLFASHASDLRSSSASGVDGACGGRTASRSKQQVARAPKTSLPAPNIVPPRPPGPGPRWRHRPERPLAYARPPAC